MNTERQRCCTAESAESAETAEMEELLVIWRCLFPKSLRALRVTFQPSPPEGEPSG